MVEFTWIETGKHYESIVGLRLLYCWWKGYGNISEVSVCVSLPKARHMCRTSEKMDHNRAMLYNNLMQTTIMKLNYT